MSTETDRGFLSRWSQRKQAARLQGDVDREQAPRDGVTEEPVDGEPEGVAGQEKPTREEIAEANQAAAEAVDLETLGFDSDFSLFLKDGVSTQLKNAALRKLWRSNPVLACVDGLNDYDDDYRTVETFADGIRSSWQVGKGYSWMSEVEEKLEAMADAVDMQPASDHVVEPAGEESEQDAPDSLEDKNSELAETPGDEEPVLTADPAEAVQEEEVLSLAAPMVNDDDMVRPRRVPSVEEPVRPTRRRVRFT